MKYNGMGGECLYGYGHHHQFKNYEQLKAVFSQ